MSGIVVIKTSQTHKLYFRPQREFVLVCECTGNKTQKLPTMMRIKPLLCSLTAQDVSEDHHLTVCQSEINKHMYHP